MFALSLDGTSGSLAPLAGSPFSPGTTFGSPAIDRSGRYLFAADLVNTSLIGFTVDSSTGALTPLGGSTPIGTHPISMTIVEAP